MSREQILRERLEQRFEPMELLIKDQSHLHAGHAGARAGGSHFDVTIKSAAFAGLKRVKRHQMVYDAVTDLMESDIHALRIRALAADE